MPDIPITRSPVLSFAFPCRDLWEERSIRSVANLTRSDGSDFLQLAPKVPIQTTVTVYPLKATNKALEDIPAGRLTGSAILEIRGYNGQPPLNDSRHAA